MDGTADVTVGARVFGLLTTVEGDFFCTYVVEETSRGCGAMFRNPGGTFEKKNEYLAIRTWASWEFSVVK